MHSAFPELPVLIDAGFTLVAPTPLLTKVLSHELAEYQMQHSHQAWERTSVHTLEGWFASCWTEARFSATSVPSLLSADQELLLWRNIIGQTCPKLFDLAAAARLARRAAVDVAKWHVPLAHESWIDHQDGSYFLVWLREFRARCMERDWMASWDLWNVLPQWIRAVTPAAKIAFLGFEIVPPALADIGKHLPHSIFVPATTAASSKIPVSGRNCFADEIEVGARWARRHLELHPSASVAILVPKLQEQKAAVERTLKNVFYPGSALHLAAPLQDTAYCVHATSALSQEPLIAHALLLLELAKHELDHAVASAVLRSPFIAGAAEERHDRARADAKLRRDRELAVTLRQLLYAAAGCPIFAKNTDAVQRLVRENARQQGCERWSSLFAAILPAMGWPGDAALTLLEQETVDLWKRCLSDFAALNLVSGPIRLNQALRLFGSLLARRPAPQAGDLFSPLQVVDAAEAQGWRVDAACIVGMSDELWPPLPERSPLLPLRVQAIAGIPGSSVSSLHAEHSRVTAALVAVAPEAFASFSGNMARSFSKWSFAGETGIEVWNGRLPLACFEEAACTVVLDTDAPRYRVDGEARGGTRIIKSQSACPFLAFAENRLHARALDRASFGFDALDRGKFVHTALELVWARLKTQAALKAMTRGDLQVLVSECVSQAIAVPAEGPVTEQSKAVEQTRLEQLILNWLLTIEAERQIPFTVEEVEKDLHYNLGGLPLNIRIDRVDRLRGDRFVLIDYKSGETTKNKLKCPRPPEPQLLIYAAAHGPAVDGIFFGEVRPSPRLVGKSRIRHLKGGANSVHELDWNAEMQQASAEVEKLAREFLSGHAAVTPRNGACTYCELRSLCRIKEQRQQEEEDCD